MSRKDVSLKKIAKNLGVECTEDDNRVCEVLCKIADEMPFFKGEREAITPLEVGMDLQGKTLYFDTTKTIPEDGEAFMLRCGIPGLKIHFSYEDGDETIKGFVANDYGYTETFYENGTWLMDSLYLGEQQGDTVISQMSEKINEYVRTNGTEKGFMDRLEKVELYSHCISVMEGDHTFSAKVNVITNSSTPITTFEQLNEISNSYGDIICSCMVNSDYFVGMLYSYDVYYNGTKKNIESCYISDTVIRLL